MTNSENQLQEVLETRSQFERELISRAWTDEAFKERLLRNPKAVYEEAIGSSIPDNYQVQVIEETPNTISLVIPKKPSPVQVDEELSEEALEAVAGGSTAVAVFFGRSIISKILF